MADYERLSAMDASFLGIEDETCHMHVGAVMLFDAAPLRTPEGGIDIDRIRKAVRARLHLVPRFRQRVAYVPWEGVPVWVVMIPEYCQPPSSLLPNPGLRKNGRS